MLCTELWVPMYSGRCHTDRSMIHIILFQLDRSCLARCLQPFLCWSRPQSQLQLLSSISAADLEDRASRLKMAMSNESARRDEFYCCGHPLGCGNRFLVSSGELTSFVHSASTPFAWCGDVLPVPLRNGMFACSQACADKFNALDAPRPSTPLNAYIPIGSTDRNATSRRRTIASKLSCKTGRTCADQNDSG